MLLIWSQMWGTLGLNRYFIVLCVTLSAVEGSINNVSTSLDVTIPVPN